MIDVLDVLLAELLVVFDHGTVSLERDDGALVHAEVLQVVAVTDLDVQFVSLDFAAPAEVEVVVHELTPLRRLACRDSVGTSRVEMKSKFDSPYIYAYSGHG